MHDITVAKGFLMQDTKNANNKTSKKVISWTILIGNSFYQRFHTKGEGAVVEECSVYVCVFVYMYIYFKILGQALYKTGYAHSQ